MKKNNLILTGSGVSKESGIPTFRDSSNGIWSKYDPKIVATSGGWEDNRDIFIEFWQSVQKEFDKNEYKPNDAHYKIAKLNNRCSLLTTNIDNLHELSGSKDVIKIHGDITKERQIEMYDGELFLENITIPDVVLFGENKRFVSECYELAEDANAVLVIGSSLLTGELSLLEHAKRCGAELIEINPSPVKECPFDRRYTMSATEGLDKFLDEDKKHYV